MYTDLTQPPASTQDRTWGRLIKKASQGKNLVARQDGEKVRKLSGMRTKTGLVEYPYFMKNYPTNL